MGMAYFEQADRQIVKAIQKDTGAVIDGYFGHQSLFNLFKEVCNIKEHLPLAITMYNGYAIYAEPSKTKLLYPRRKNSVNDFNFAGSGTFQNGATNKLVSLFVVDGEVIHPRVSKAWRNAKVSTLYYTYTGDLGLKRVKYASELPKNVKWAISGVGLVKDNNEKFYNPKLEGFYGSFADVLRKTNHVVLGVTKHNEIVYILQPFCTMGRLLWLVKNVYDLKYAISLDGGHIPAINTPKFSYNKYQKQNNMIIFR